MVLPLWRGRGERLALFDDINPEHFEGLVAGLGVVNRAFRDLVGFPGLDLEWRLAVDQKLKLALQHVTGFGAGVGMTTRSATCGNLGDRRNGVVAGRKFEFLQRRALDTALLGDGRA